MDDATSPVNETPDYPSWWWVLGARIQSRWWAIEHWALTHLTRLHFCHSCSGYFRAWCMMLPDKCDACYARDHGILPEHEAYDPVLITSPFTSQ